MSARQVVRENFNFSVPLHI